MALKVILIHGMNNNLESFSPLKEKLSSYGLNAEILCLPGHKDNREESKDLKTAFHHFDQSMKKLMQDPYVIVAFSQGALYLQLWLEKNSLPRPKAQVLLAPALFIKGQSRLEKLMTTLPRFLFILSQTPKPLRRYFSLYVWEYRTLFQGIKKFQSMKSAFRIPTMVIVDPKDELVDAKMLKDELEKRNPDGLNIHFQERPHLKGRRPGKYHILFHPNYFEKEEWDVFCTRISEFLKQHL